MKFEFYGTKQKKFISNFLHPTIPKMLFVGMLLFIIGVFTGGYLPQSKELNLRRVQTYIVKSNEVVILQDTIHTFGDTLEIDKYHQFSRYPKSFQWILSDNKIQVEF